MSEPRICFVGDTHANLPFVVAAIDAAKSMGAQILLQVGDFGIWDHVPEGIAYLDGVQEALEAADMWLIFCAGNHDNYDTIEATPVERDGFQHIRPRIWHAPRGHIWEMQGVSFMAMGGAHSIDSWEEHGGIWRPRRPKDINPTDVLANMLFDMQYAKWRASRKPHEGWWPQEMITPEDVQTALDNFAQWGRPIDVMIAHDVPAGVKIPRSDRKGWITGYKKGDENRTLLKHVVQEVRPQLLVSGHYHVRHSATFGDSTRVEILDRDRSSDALLLMGLDPFRLILNSA